MSGLVLCLVLTWAPASAGDSSGAIEGAVSVGDLRPRPMRFSPVPDVVHESRTGRRDPATDERRNVVVYLEQARVPLDHEPSRHAIEQHEGRFEPHVLPVMRGARVAFPSSDAVLHSVYALSKAASFDLGRFPPNRVREVDFNTPGVVRVSCHRHPDMTAVILVLDNPFFAVPDASGRFRIAGAPPGDYIIAAWHERAEPVRRRIRVQPGRATWIELRLPIAESIALGR